MKKHLLLKIAKGALIVLLILSGMAAIGCTQLKCAVQNLQRIDESGMLYSLDYVSEYENPLIKLPVKLIKACGCTAFSTQNEQGEMITARNYDLMHTDADGNATGLNVIFTLQPKGKYASINIADAAWFSEIGIPCTAGAPDRNGISRMLLGFLPYLCMDGMNEKGLTVSILAVDIRPGETATNQNVRGCKTVMITELLRLILDNCADVQEAAELAAGYNMTGILQSDYHLFVTDADGSSGVLEWRYNQLSVTYQDLVTNFYVASDDAADYYKDGVLKEEFVCAEGQHYHYGYGHGYARFKEAAEMLSKHVTDTDPLTAKMSEEEAMDTLKRVSQAYDGTEITSNTQYSVLYNAADLTAEVCVMRNYRQHYYFSLER